MIKKIFSNCKKVLPCIYDGALSVAEQIAKLFKRTDDLAIAVKKRVEKSTLPYNPDKTYVYGTNGGGYEKQIPLDVIHDVVSYGVIPQRGPNNVLYGNTEQKDTHGEMYASADAYINKKYFDEHAASAVDVADLQANKRDIVAIPEKGEVARIYSVTPKSDEIPDGKQSYLEAGVSNFKKYTVPQRSVNGQIELPNQTTFPPSLNQAMSRREMRKYLPAITGVPSYQKGEFNEALPVDEKVTGVTDGSLVRRNADGRIMGTYSGNPSPLISEGESDERYIGRFEFSQSDAGLVQVDGNNWSTVKRDHNESDLTGDKWVVEKGGVAAHDAHGSLYSTATVKDGTGYVTEGSTEQVLTHQLARNSFALSEIAVETLWNSNWFGPNTNFNGVNDAVIGNIHNAKIQIIDNTNFPTTTTSQSTAYLQHIDYNLAIVDLYTRTLNASGEITKLEIYKGVYLGDPIGQTSKSFKKTLIATVEF